MVLIISEQGDLSADLVVRELERRGAPFARLNTDRLLMDSCLTFEEPVGVVSLIDEHGTIFDLRKVRSIWYRRVAVPKAAADAPPPVGSFAGREALAHLLGAALSLDAYWMSRPDAIWRANHKLLQLRVALSLGLPIPATVVTASPDRAFEFVQARPGNVIAKPVSYGLIEGVEPNQAIYTTRLPKGLSRSDFDALSSAPVIFQEEVPKRCDVRATIIGRDVYPVAIDSQEHADTQVDWRHPVSGLLNHRVVALPDGVRTGLLRLMDALGLEFGAVDLVEQPDGTFVFLEINPNGQWGWIQVATGLDLAGALAKRLIDGPQA